MERKSNICSVRRQVEPRFNSFVTTFNERSTSAHFVKCCINSTELQAEKWRESRTFAVCEGRWSLVSTLLLPHLTNAALVLRSLNAVSIAQNCKLKNGEKVEHLQCAKAGGASFQLFCYHI